MDINRDRLLGAAGKRLLAEEGVFFGLYAAVLWYLHTQQFRPERYVLEQYVSDSYPHLDSALRGKGYSLNSIFLRLFYALGNSAGCGLLFTLFDLWALVLAVRLLRRLAPGLPQPVYPVAALAACHVMAWRLPFSTMTYFLGTIMGTLYHNMTYASMKCFALLALTVFIDLYAQRRERLSRRTWVWFTVWLSLSTACKPSFAVVFGPALLLLLVVDLWQTRGKNLLNEVLLGCTVLPSIGLALLQGSKLFSETSGNVPGGGVQFAPMAEFNYWALETGEVPLTLILRSLVFPLLVLVCFGLRHRRDAAYRFSWLLFAVAFAESALLMDGARPTHGNFRWGTYFAVFVLFLSATCVLLRELRAAWPRWNAKLLVCGGALVWQAAMGLYYFLLLFRGGDYTI